MHDIMASADIFPMAQSVLLTVWSNTWPYVVMLLGFSLIVFVHELGHFMVAKWADVRVEKFAVGFGRELFGFTRGETRYSFNVLPLGGYVKMLGQEDFDDKTLELRFKDDPRSFVNKTVGRRMAIVSAGVIMNVLFACLLFMIVFMVGMEAVGTRIAYVVPDSPADRAGLLPGDMIREIDGERILEFREVYTSVMLAPLHEKIEFVVERGGETRRIELQPQYLFPENTREARRQIVGISPGATREIARLGPEIDTSKPDQPHVGDMLVEIDGIEVTDENASEVINTLVYAKGDVIVERKDPTDPTAPPKRVKVNIPPILTIYPTTTDGTSEIHVLGMSPLLRFSAVDTRGRAHLAGLAVGDTVLAWDDKPYPSKTDIMRSVRECPERDLHFRVRRSNGRIATGFVRPKRHKRGPGTVQAICRSIPEPERAPGGPRAAFGEVRPMGQAGRAGIESGDVILSCGVIENPTRTEVNRTIRKSVGVGVPLTLRKADGRTVSLFVEPEAPGAIDAGISLVADDVLRVGRIVETINGKPSPAARAGLEMGTLITAVNGESVSTWRGLIGAMRTGAGSSVSLSVIDAGGVAREVAFPVPHSLRTLLGAGPEARIVSVDGRKTITIDSRRGREEVSVGYRKGTGEILRELVGREQVAVEYRANPLAEVQTKHIDMTADMVDPWVGRIAFSANIDVKPELKLLKGENALDAVMIGVHKTFYFIRQVYLTMERMFFTRSVGVENVSGPLGIIDMGGKVARAGVIQFIFFMAIISANLAVINFLPLPIVDGGLMIFLMIEKIKGGPVSIRVQVATQMIGLFLIIGVFLYVTFNDVMRMWG